MNIPPRSVSLLLFCFACSLPLCGASGSKAPVNDAILSFDGSIAGDIPPGLDPGIKLSGEDLAASIEHGGDGVITVFKNGHLALPPNHRIGGGKALTLVVRFKFKPDTPPSQIIRWPADKNRNLVSVATDARPSGKHLVVTLSTDARDTPLALSVPLSSIGADSWHDLAVRYSGHLVQLYVDGVIVDEEWPLGALPEAKERLLLGPAAKPGVSALPLQGMIDHVYLWNRALSDDELLAFWGNTKDIAKREERFFGPRQPVGQFWTPRGIDTHFGDPMPFFHNGRFHLFYLIDRRHHKSKWKLGAHQWAHVSTSDLTHWDEHPLAIAITHEGEGSICTGSAFEHEGVYYGFYAVRKAGDMPGPRLNAATSTDGIHFQKTFPIAELTHPYRAATTRDPVVFRDPKTGIFHMLVTTSLTEPAIADQAGCLAHLISKDLKNWEQQEPFLVPGYHGEPECPDHFFWKGWYYLVFSNNGVARYRMSRSPLGPWQRPAVDSFDCSRVHVIKTAAFTGDRRLGVGFLTDNAYGGVAIFRELVQQADGSLRTTWPKELIPPLGPKIALATPPIAPGVTGTGDTIEFAAPSANTAPLCATSLGRTPKSFMLKMTVCPSPGAASFGMRFRASANMRGGFELRIEPAKEKVGLRDPGLNSVEEGEQTALYNVDGLTRPFELQVLVKDRWIDVCVDGRRTLAAPIPTHAAGDEIFLFSHESGVTLKNIDLRSVVER